MAFQGEVAAGTYGANAILTDCGEQRTASANVVLGKSLNGTSPRAEVPQPSGTDGGAPSWVVLAALVLVGVGGGIAASSRSRRTGAAGQRTAPHDPAEHRRAPPRALRAAPHAGPQRSGSSTAHADWTSQTGPFATDLRSRSRARRRRIASPQQPTAASSSATTRVQPGPRSVPSAIPISGGSPARRRPSATRPASSARSASRRTAAARGRRSGRRQTLTCTGSPAPRPRSATPPHTPVRCARRPTARRGPRSDPGPIQISTASPAQRPRRVMAPGCSARSARRRMGRPGRRSARPPTPISTTSRAAARRPASPPASTATCAPRPTARTGRRSARPATPINMGLVLRHADLLHRWRGRLDPRHQRWRHDLARGDEQREQLALRHDLRVLGGLRWGRRGRQHRAHDRRGRGRLGRPFGHARVTSGRSTVRRDGVTWRPPTTAASSPRPTPA